MMGAFRAFAKSPVAAVLMGLLIISFGIWGVRDVFKVRISDAVVQAGSREIGSADFKQRFQQQLQQFQQQTGQTVSADEAAKQGMVQQFAQDLGTGEAVQEAIRRNGVQASDKLVIDELRKIPAFFNPVTGTFEEQTYEQLLSQHNLTPLQFQQQLKDQLATTHFTTGMVAGLQAPASYAVLLAALDQQTRVADYFLLDPRGQPTPAKPTDAQLNQLMTQFADQLRRPEFRQISMVRVSAQAIAQTLHPKDADVQAMFNQAKSRLSTPERRTFVQIPVKDAAQAAAVAARLGKGEDASAIAKSYGVKPLSFADIPQAAVTDPMVAQAVFAMQPGQTSGAIRGQFGLAVAKLISITPAKPATLEEARPQIEKDLNDKAAKNAAYDQSGAYSDAHEKGQQMTAAAKTAGVQVFALPPITADGKMPNRQPLPSINQKMLKDAFSLPQGGETDMTDLGGGEYYALRVDKVLPAAMPTLDQVRAPLTNAYLQRAVLGALQAKADALTQRVKKGEAISAVAASAGGKLMHLELTRSSADQQQQALGQELLAKLFTGKAGDAFDARAANYGFAVVKIDAVKPGSVADIARESASMRGQLSQQMGRDEFGEMFYTAARTQIKPKVDLALAYQAIGVQPPPTTTAAGGKASGKAP